ncbi:hypothetical protein [uncultured Cardiobacterium sp.]|uniref:hypothetical protein n=1 Tax=uncultured Cardiobacterium sp. TaxID=417619 RepID=UPI0026310AE1|nr:hypothetical protein [uncultured Cardiobacterium sp.]
MMTLWLILRDSDGNETAVEEDLPGLFFAEETLDDQCDALGVTRISEFVDGSEMVEDMDDFLDSDEFAASLADFIAENGHAEEMNALADEMRADRSRVEPEWHDPQGLLRSIRALRAHYTAHPGGFDEADEACALEDVLDDIEKLEPVLQQAVANGQTVHLRLL